MPPGVYSDIERLKKVNKTEDDESNKKEKKRKFSTTK